MKSISHAPNTDFLQQVTALMLLVLPWNWLRWRNGRYKQILQRQLLSYLKTSGSVFSFSTAREGLSAILRALDVQEGDEVILQSYTCIVVPNAILWSGATPIYVDIDASYNLDPDALRQAISKKTKAIIVQHTFGYPAQMSKILALADEFKIPVIEDCAHSLGAEVNGSKVGTLGIAAFYSFGRDKMISSVSGGMVVTKDTDLAQKLKKLQESAVNRPYRWIFQNLFHPILVPFSASLMGKFKIGQLLLTIFQKLGLLNKVYRTGECEGTAPDSLFYQMPNAMSLLASQQMKSFPKRLQRRRHIADIYERFCREQKIDHQQTLNGIPAPLRFSLQTTKPQPLLTEAKRNGYLLGNWYQDVLMPRPVSWEMIHYKPGSCPKAEAIAGQTVNLPTYPKLKEKDIEQILNIVKTHYEH